jgi:hypothetical protein
MKKLFSLFALALVILTSANASDSTILTKKATLSKGTIEYNGHSYPCDIAEYPANADLVEGALKDMMSARGHKSDAKKGFLVYRNITMPRTTIGHPVDVFAKIEGKGKGENEKALIYMIVTKPGEIPDKKEDGFNPVVPIAIAGTGAAVIADLENNVSNADHLKRTDLQSENVQKLEKEVKGLEKDQTDMQKKLEKLQKDMADNLKLQEEIKTKLATELSKLESMKGAKLLPKKAD